MRMPHSLPPIEPRHTGVAPSFRELEILCAMMATRKTTAAAMTLGISQPAVSRALAALERRLGRHLFSRSGGRLTPTADAFALQAEAAPIFTALERLKEWPHPRAQAGTLRIIAASTLAHGFLSLMLPRFHILEPEIEIQVEIGRSPDVIATIADRKADVGLVDQAASHSGVRAQPFRRATAHVAMLRSHRLAGLEWIDPIQLVGEPLIALARRLPARAEIDRCFASRGLTPQIVAESATAALALELVRQGMGVAILNPFPFSLTPDPHLVFRRFSDDIVFETSILEPDMMPPNLAARRLIDFIRREQPGDGCSTIIT